MSQLPYLVPRVIRHFMPGPLVRLLLLSNLIIKPGLETANPDSAVNQYQQVLQEYGESLEGKRVLVLGYGGRFATGCELLLEGAAHVILCEYKVTPDHIYNRALVENYPQILDLQGSKVVVNPDRLTVLEGDIKSIAAQNNFDPVDIVLSNSVYEHLSDVPGITNALVKIATSNSVCLHFIDLRDHFFKYPFAMLTYPTKTWYRWLNPSSNHNRWRYWDYQATFLQKYREVNITILAREVEAFQQAEPHILPDFKRGTLEENCATIIQVFARNPIKTTSHE